MRLRSLNIWLKYSIGVLIFVGLAGLLMWVLKNNESRRCQGIIVKLDNPTEHELVTQKDIVDWVTDYQNNTVEGKVLSRVELGKIEKKVAHKSYFSHCEAYIDLNSNLVIKAEVEKPIARIYGRGRNLYLTKEGKVFPSSKHYADELLLLTGDYFANIDRIKQLKESSILEFVKFISEEKFWNAQLTQLDIDPNGEIKIVPNLGKNVIAFGKAENFKNKLERLMYFYLNIMPQKEYANFSQINVKFDGQIVCN